MSDNIRNIYSSNKDFESSNVDDDENHSGKDQCSIEDVSISALQWTEFTGELKLRYFVATAVPMLCRHDKV